MMSKKMAYKMGEKMESSAMKKKEMSMGKKSMKMKAKKKK
jgi:hypothetical protein